jgi:hypothetical protein
MFKENNWEVMTNGVKYIWEVMTSGTLSVKVNDGMRLLHVW